MNKKDRKNKLCALVEEVKQEMISEGKRYVEPTTKYRVYSKNGKKIIPEFGMLLSNMEKKPEPVVKNDLPIQFRGTPKPTKSSDPLLTIWLEKDTRPILRGKRI